MIIQAPPYSPMVGRPPVSPQRHNHNLHRMVNPAVRGKQKEWAAQGIEPPTLKEWKYTEPSSATYLHNKHTTVWHVKLFITVQVIVKLMVMCR